MSVCIYACICNKANFSTGTSSNKMIYVDSGTLKEDKKKLRNYLLFLTRCSLLTS